MQENLVLQALLVHGVLMDLTENEVVQVNEEKMAPVDLVVFEVLMACKGPLGLPGLLGLKDLQESPDNQAPKVMQVPLGPRAHLDLKVLAVTME